MAADTNMNPQNDLPTFTIYVNGSEMDGTYQMKNIEVYKEVNRVTTALIVINDGDPATGDFPISDKDDFKPGAEIEIKAGYHSNEETVFKGIVIKHGLRVRKNTGPVLEIECRDKAIQMTVNRKNAYYLNSTDSDAISKIIGTYSALSSSVESTSLTYKELVQYYSTDWDFILSRAEINGQVIVVDDGKVTIAAPAVSGSPVLELEYGNTIMEFNAEMNAAAVVSGAKGNAWGISGQALINGTTSSVTINEQGNISASDLSAVLATGDYMLQSSAPLDSSLLTTWTKARLQKSWLARIRGKVKFQGNSSVKHGQLIQLTGVGDRFNGNAYVSAVRHEINSGNWVTEASFGMSDEWFSEKTDVSYPEAAGLLPSIQGLQTGVVMKIDSDPDNLYRVQVKIPIMGDDSDGIWARMGNFYATNNAGSFFLPEINDEVILGFVNNDPCYPVILGMLYGGNHAPPYTADSENSMKAIVTKNQLKVTFSDKDKIIQIVTPGNNLMTFSDKDGKITITDQNNNSIEMSSKGITIDSKSDIEITASGNIKIAAQGNLEESAQGNVTVSGTNISTSAKANLNLEAKANLSVAGLNISEEAKVSYTAKGNASAELSASGSTTIKGAIVMIN